MKKKFTFLMAACMLLTILTYPLTGWSQAKSTTYKLTAVTSVSAGNKYVFEQSGYVMNNTISTTTPKKCLVTTTTYNITGLTGNETYVWTLESVPNSSNFYMKNEQVSGDNKYLNNSGSSTDMSWSASGSAVWSFAFSNGVATITNTSNSRFLGFNDSHYYKAYASGNSNAHAITVYLLEEVSTTPTVTVSPATLTDFTYVYGHGPSASQEFTVSGANLGNNTISVSVTDYYEISSDGSSFGSSVTPLAPTEGTVGETTLYVRMKSGLTDSPSGTITAASTGATSQTITLSGSVTPTYTVTCATILSNGSIVSDKETAASGETVTITATPASGYKLATVTVTETGGSNTVTPSVSGNTATFTMPAYNVTVSATFAQEYTITCATGLSYGSIVSDKETAVLGETVTITATPASGYKLRSITVTKNGGGTIDAGDIEYEDNTAIFAMPADNVTVSATFEVYYTVTYDGNDNTGGSVPEDNNTYFYDDDVTVLGNTGSLVKTHYTFSTWNTANNGSGDNRTPESTFQIKGNTTLYAIYTPNENGYDLTLDGETSHATAKLQKYVSSTWTDVVEEEEIPYNTLLKVATTPDDGYDCIVTVIDNDDNTIELNVNNEFRMPDAKITITVNIVPDNEVTYDFHFDVMGSTGWSSSYEEHTVQYDEATVTFVSADKNSSTITDIPVTKGNDVKVVMKNDATLEGVSFECRQWGSNAHTITLYYSTNGGTTYSTLSPSVTSTNFSISKDGLPTGTNAVKIGFSGSGQVGVESATLKIKKQNIAIYSPILNGSVSASKSSIIPGRTVTLTATPETNYVLGSWDVYKTGESATKVTVTNNQFTMPGYDVTVNASFRTPTTFTVQFSINGSIDDDLTEPDIVEGNSIDLPTGITCSATSLAFKGWSTSETEVASVLTGSYTPTDDIILHAVFGKSDLTYSFDITYADFNSTSYIANNNEKTSTATTSGSETMLVKWTSNHIMLSSSKIQWYASTDAYIYNSTDIGTIQSVTMSSDGDKFTTYYGSSEQPTSNTTVGNRYFKIVNTSSATQKISSITITFKKSYNYTRFIDVTSDVDLGGNVPAAYIYTIKNGHTLTITGNLGDENNLIVENGGELIVSSTRKDVKATVKKTVAASTAVTPTIPAENYWYAISSPTHDDNKYYESFSNVSNLTPGGSDKYNVYRYDEKTVVWQEHRDKDNEFNTMKKGRGYLFRTTKGGDLEYVGAVNTDTVQYKLSRLCSTDKFRGFNLIGNPYTHTIYKGAEGSAIPNGDILEDKYYVIGTNGRLTLTADGTAIAPGQAIFVQAKEVSTLTMNNSTSGKVRDKYANDNIWFMVKNAESSDLACVEFRKGHGLNKVEHRNDITPMLYIMHNGENFASADMSDNTSVINLGFEAKTTGEYTFSLKARGTYSYMHLIDKITGADVDMLIEDSYSFVGSPRDRKDRFELRLNYNAANIDSESDIFAYQNCADIIVRGEGELQVFDVTGRMAMKRQINGVQTVNGLNNGVYIFRLVGTEVKTQKIVVR